MNIAPSGVVRSLLRAEAEINLLARCNPTNAAKASETARESWLAGRPLHPAFEFAPRPDFSQLRRALEALEQWLGSRGSWSDIWAARARELVLEAQIVEAVGTPLLPPLSRRRFSVEQAHERAIARLARCWATLHVDAELEELIPSDDATNPNSLLRLMRAEVERLKIPVPVRIGATMMARAAVDDTAVWIKPAVLMGTTQAKRIVVHEVHGHVIRRFRGRKNKNLPFRCGVVDADVDEEGRALWLEAQSGGMTASRKVELGRRHLMAQACRDGASFVEGVELLQNVGTPLDEALAVGVRVWRGGGLAREIVYLTGYTRAARQLRQHPELDDWMSKGRLSFAVAARVAQGELPLNEVD